MGWRVQGGGPFFYLATLGLVVTLGAAASALAVAAGWRDLEVRSLPYARARTLVASFQADASRPAGLAPLRPQIADEASRDRAIAPKALGAPSLSLTAPGPLAQPSRATSTDPTSPTSASRTTI